MMNTNEAIAYLNYEGPIWLNKIEFLEEPKKCGCGKKEKEDTTSP